MRITSPVVLRLMAMAGVGTCFVDFASAQCAVSAMPLVEFSQSVTSESGGQRTVYATVAWDPDGEGPEPEWLVIGGNFDRVGSVASKYVAAWDGTSWRSFNVDFVPGREVFTLAVHQGRLVAGGSFRTIGGEFVGGLVELVPGGWRLFEGQPGPQYTAGGPIKALVSYGESLYVGGEALQSSDDAFGSLVVRWDGTRYRTTGLRTGLGEEVRALAIHDGELYATGRFIGVSTGSLLNIARYDGSSWHPVGGGFATGGTGMALATFEGLLYAGRGGSGSGTGRVSAWDGASWMDAGGPLSSSGVRALTVHDGVLIGATQASGSIPPSTQPVYALRESGWSALEPGTSPSFVGDFGTIYSLSHHNGDLISGGARYKIGSTRHAGGIARFVDGMWTTVDHSLDSTVLSLLASDAGIIATGMFTSIGGIFSPGVAMLTPEGVEAIDSPVRFVDHNKVRVRSATMWDDRLVLVGNFASDGSYSMGVVIREGDGTWHVPEHSFAWFDGWQAVGLSDTLYVLSNVAGPSSGTRSVVVWRDGIWELVTDQSGLNAIGTLGDALVVAGSFSSIGGTPAQSIAMYENSTWSTLGGGFSGTVTAVAKHRGALLASGAFTIVDTGETANLARWNGHAWERVPTPDPGTFQYVLSVDSGLVAGTPGRRFMLYGGRWIEIPGLGVMHTGIGAVERVVDGVRQLVTTGLTNVLTTSYGTPFVVDLPCEADLNCDGEADILDFLEYLQAFGACDGAEPGCDVIRADFDQNGAIDIMDVMAFMDAFGSGCG